MWNAVQECAGTCSRYLMQAIGWPEATAFAQAADALCDTANGDPAPKIQR